MSDSFLTPWTVDYETPLSMGFLRQEYWNGLPFSTLDSLSVYIYIYIYILFVQPGFFGPSQEIRHEQ